MSHKHIAMIRMTITRSMALSADVTITMSHNKITREIIDDYCDATHDEVAGGVAFAGDCSTMVGNADDDDDDDEVVPAVVVDDAAAAAAKDGGGGGTYDAQSSNSLTCACTIAHGGHRLANRENGNRSFSNNTGTTNVSSTAINTTDSSYERVRTSVQRTVNEWMVNGSYQQIITIDHQLIVLISQVPQVRV
jgi:hypothetical protein